ncbi:hypothetical protein VB776_17595 [Arcicella sp. DC2W]|uniref:Uncharacterized protein n=1 Tax=Arcicella gelida TaxID=2984195 RepID=A0ABU5S8F2_9BACT|nr:hypothetical protein [Arcicella sp. DC2W]MEA5404753.1 hypothetical protein [Arcicella sp. DC2W]
MSTTSESGQAKNLANFETLISYCINFEERYNPSREDLKIANLQALLTKTKAALAEHSLKVVAQNHAISQRQEAFASLKSLSTKLVNAFRISGVDDLTVARAKAINRKIQGKKALSTLKRMKKETPEEPIVTISTSQQSYNYLVEHLDALVRLLAAHPEYHPNEIPLQIPTLKAYINQLRACNLAVMNTHVEYSGSRSTKNTLLYHDKTGLLDIALDVKAYIKVIFGVKSYEYGLIKGISFKRRDI